MEQLVEFIGNHPYLCLAFVGTVGVLVYTEFDRFSSGIQSLTPYAATQLLNGGDAIFLDVRDDTDFKKGHVIDARNISVSSIDKRITELDKFKDQDVVVYCDTGMRSAKVAQKLKKNGFTKPHNLAGGLAAWEKASLPLVTK